MSKVTMENGTKKMTGTRRPGRPIGFDRSVALRAAMLVFWKHGFDATSYPDLIAATGMSKPTLYATFGDKMSLFRHAVAAYSSFSAAAFEEVLNRPTAREAATAYLLLSRGLERKAGEPIVCFLAQGALSGGAETQELREELSAVRRETTAKLQARLERAQREYDLPDEIDASVLAEYLSSLAVGLSVQAAGGSTAEQLNRVVTMTMAQWPGK